MYQTIYSGQCDWNSPLDSQPTTFTLKMNTQITNKEEMIVFIILYLLGIILLYKQLRQIGMIKLLELKGSNLDILRSHNIILLVLGLIQQLSLTYVILGQFFGKIKQHFSFLFISLPLIQLNYFLLQISVDLFIQMNSKYSRNINWLSIIIILFGYIFTFIVTIYQCCKRMIDSYQYYVITSTILTDIIYTLSNLKYYNNLKQLKLFNNQIHKQMLKWAIILIFIGTIYRVIYLLLRVISYEPVRDFMKLIKFKDYQSSLEDDSCYWFILQFLYFILCDYIPRYLLMLIYKPAEYRATGNLN